MRVNGVRCDPVSLEELRRAISTFARCRSSHVVNFLAADPTVIARDDVEYRETLERADLNVADGMSLVWAMRLSGVRAQKIAGTDAMRSLTAWAAREGAASFLYGGAPGVAEGVRMVLQESIPGAKIAGVETPPFGPVDEDEVANAAARIRSSGADLVWVGLGTPKQHLVADRLRSHDAARVILCVGAAFDFISGAKRRPAEWLQRSGLEWAGRLADEPTRLWRRYVVGNSRFVAGVARDLIHPR